MSVDWDKLIELLAEKNLLGKLQGKRPGVPKLPALLYIRLIMASLATEKEISSCITTALETYIIRNEEKHFTEIKIKAIQKGVSVEEFLSSSISDRTNNS